MLARRAMILNSLGKGSVVVAAAAVPMHTLAGQSTRCKTDGIGGTPVHACVSGMHSAVGSLAASWPVSRGFHCSWYKTKSNWPYVEYCDYQFKTIFGGTKTTKCYDIVKYSPTSAECRWVTAWLNAQKCQTTFNYPYNRDEVSNMYKNNSPARSSCEQFFGTYMETMGVS
jgi:hypothetical protein